VILVFVHSESPNLLLPAAPSLAAAIQWLADEAVVADLIGLIARSQANLKKRLIMLL
jgi:hypothetical protein